MSYGCASADAEIHVNAVAPYALRFTVTSSDFDLSLVTAGELRVKRGDGATPDVWSAGIENQAAGSLDLVHVFTTGDVPDPELLLIQPHLTHTSGELVAATKTLAVRPEFT